MRGFRGWQRRRRSKRSGPLLSEEADPIQSPIEQRHTEGTTGVASPLLRRDPDFLAWTPHA
jgi:hypothetical protein